MATAMHFEALRKQRVLEKAKDAQERAAAMKAEIDGKTSEKKETVDRDEMARLIYKDLHKQEQRLRDSCLVMGPLETYVDDEDISKRVEEARKTQFK